MNIYIGIATMAGREMSLKKTLQSIMNQTLKATKVFVYDNSRNEDKADNGKFYAFTQQLEEPYYFLSIDDDILYPKTYISDMVEAIDHYQCIVSHHGRKLLGMDRDYYRGHKAYDFRYEVKHSVVLDVIGTGVAGFHSSYFKVGTVFDSPHKRMSDLIFSLEATEKGKKMVLLPHPKGYLIDICKDDTNSCHKTERKNTKQIEIANEIWKIKSKN